MTVGDLRKKIDGVDDNMLLLIPFSHEFDGHFYSPCLVESGVSEMGVEEVSEEDLMEMELLNKEVELEKHFLLVPCGFSEEKDHSHELN